jgi:ATP-dependent Lon protease
MAIETRDTETAEHQVPKVLPLVPLRESVVFPRLVVPLGVGREKSVAALNAAMEQEKHFIVLAAQKDGEVDEVDEQGIYRVGTVANIVRILRIPDGSAQIIVQGLSRVRIDRFLRNAPYFVVETTPLPDDVAPGIELEALVRNVRGLFEQYVSSGGSVLPEHAVQVRGTEDPAYLADLISASPELSLEQKQQLLETRSVVERLKILSVFLTKQNEILELKQKIQSEVQQTLDKTQREYILREQMKAIQRELGEDEGGSEARELREKIEQSGMPDAVKEKALKEVERLSKIPQASPEQGVIRTYVDWLVSVPWKESPAEDWDLKEAKRILDEDHFGLEKVKDRILEYMAVRKLSQNLRAPILCFVGPPGVGKTSLGKSIARAMGRKFVRMSLGGIRDEAEIRGHRRTYVGALPGRILQNMKTAGTKNPVFMLDEIDKVGADFRGDPSSALLEVLDPEQNNSFSDHYLEVPYDLSKVIFITTANIVDTILSPLRDRMEIIFLPGYTEDEKVHIAKGYLEPRQLREHGLSARPTDGENPSEEQKIFFTEDGLRAIIREYTREAGVRNLEREIATICRKVARRYAEGETSPVTIEPDQLATYLGPARFDWGMVEEKEDQVGAATGVSVSEHGGDVLTVEATVIEGKVEGNRDFMITGQIGKVMEESARAALSYVRARQKQLGIPEDYFDDHAIHVHVPAGAIPKDGPSAGVTMLTAMVSAVTGRRVRREVAMTGEITLRGKVLPIGGVKEKLLAAHRAGVKTFILPQKNKKDLVDIPKEVLDQVEIKTVSDASDVLQIALQQPIAASRADEPVPASVAAASRAN